MSMSMNLSRLKESLPAQESSLQRYTPGLFGVPLTPRIIMYCRQMWTGTVLRWTRPKRRWRWLCTTKVTRISTNLMLMISANSMRVTRSMSFFIRLTSYRSSRKSNLRKPAKTSISSKRGARGNWNVHIFARSKFIKCRLTYDALVLCKIAHDAGVDLKRNPINYYCNQFGDQVDVFFKCMERIFGEIEHTFEGMDEHGESFNTYRVPLPELKEFYPLLKQEEKGKYVLKFNKMLSISDDFFCEFEMEGEMAGNCIHISFHGEYGYYSQFLESMVVIRNEVSEVIHPQSTDCNANPKSCLA